MMENTFIKDVIKFFTNKLLIVSVVICAVFYLVVMRLFDLQIVNGENYLENMRFTTSMPISVPAPRGTIYDRHGRPLAVNQSSFIIKIDPSITVENINTMLYDLVKLFEQNGDKYVDDFPIIIDESGEFSFNVGDSRRQLWLKDMDMKVSMTAEEAFYFLRDLFKVDMSLSDAEARKLLNFRSMVYMKRYKREQQITVANDVCDSTVAAIEEGNIGQEGQYSKYPSVYVDIGSLRYYPAGKYLSHILGYIRTINDSELKDFKSKGYDDYDSSSIVGKSGIELAFERELKGKDGSMLIEVNQLRKRLNTVGEPVNPVQGDKIFLTVDLDLTIKVQNILEETLTQILKAKLQGLSKNEDPITLKQLFKSMVTSNNIPASDIMEAGEGSYTFNIKNYVLGTAPDSIKEAIEASGVYTEEEKNAIKEIINEGIERGRLSSVQMLLTMYELGIITGDEVYINRIKNGGISPLSVVLDKLDSGEITPQMTYLDPCTASAVVADVKTGDVLAAVGYPTYDNNDLINNFNTVYPQLNQDKTAPMNNRPFNEPRAPGSTFKMITAVAGLESGVITPTSTIYDEHTFTTAGVPYTSCWSAVTHGRINVVGALEGSCNFFFCETAYRMGNTKNGNKLDSINAMNDYMKYFGLNERTGVEITELYDFSYYRNAPNVISSPDFKKYRMESSNSNATQLQYDWYDGDTVKTSIGQAINNYTAATMAKYIATIANKGTRYQFHLLDRIETQQGELVREVEPVVEDNSYVQISDTTWDAIYKGMRQVIEGSSGTGRNAFANFPVKVAGKTGTAQEDLRRSDHSSFGGFAPYDDPEIAVYVLIPFGDTKAYPAAASQAARKIIAEYMGIYSQPQTGGMDNSLVR